MDFTRYMGSNAHAKGNLENDNDDNDNNVNSG